MLVGCVDTRVDRMDDSGFDYVGGCVGEACVVGGGKLLNIEGRLRNWMEFRKEAAWECWKRIEIGGNTLGVS